MTKPFSTKVDFNFYNIDEAQFIRILMRVTTSVANSYFKQQFSINEIYNHVYFIDGDRTNLHVNNLILVCYFGE